MTVTTFAFIKAFNFQPFMKIKNKVAVALGRRGGKSTSPKKQIPRERTQGRQAA
jgi:hypothetical protein